MFKKKTPRCNICNKELTNTKLLGYFCFECHKNYKEDLTDNNIHIIRNKIDNFQDKNLKFNEERY